MQYCKKRDLVYQTMYMALFPKKKAAQTDILFLKQPVDDYLQLNYGTGQIKIQQEELLSKG